MEESIALPHIRDALEQAGIPTSGRSPFMTWVHPDWGDVDSSAGWDGTRLYVRDIPVPCVAPVDIAEICLTVNDHGVYFAFTLYFYTVLKDAMEAEDFRRIHDMHENEWLPRLREYYLDVSSRFSLEWDVEYDESIEDSLCRNFMIEEGNRVVEATQALRDFQVVM